MINPSPPDRTSAVTPMTSMRSLSSQVHSPYVRAKRKNRPLMSPNSRASMRMSPPSVLGALVGALRRRAVRPAGVERVRRHRPRRLADRGERLRLPVQVVVAEAGQRVEGALVVGAGAHPHLEVHLGVLSPAELRAAPDVGAADLGPQLELVVLVL